MRVLKKYTRASLVVTAAALILGLNLLWQLRETPERIELRRFSQLALDRRHISQQLSSAFLNNQLVESADLTLQNRRFKASIEYTIDRDLQKEAEKLLKQYKPDYGAIVVMDPLTGKILAMASQQNKGKPLGNLALRATYPAASIFKIVTATAALDKYDISPDTLIMFNGANHTLYKKNVMGESMNRWTRMMSVREAFARSVNTVFGKLALNFLQPDDLNEYAIRFGFNKLLQTDMPVDISFTQIPKEKSFHLSEIASGFNKVTTMSPVQGAMIAASVADMGTMKTPYIVERIKDESGKVVFQSEPINAAVTMTPQGAGELKELMEETVKSGTSRKSFRPVTKDRRFRELEIGGKTGSLTGDNPRGRTDWFVGYAISDNRRLAVSAITVNVDYWTVKSAFLAQSMVKKYFKEQFTERNEKFFQASQTEH